MMAEIASMWSYEENNEMEQLGQKLMCTTLELEKLKAEAMEEMRKNKEQITQLIELLKCAIQERDEARNECQKLLNKTSITTESFPSIPMFQAGRANSSITESNSLSETYNLHSHGSSPVDSLFDTVSSPEFSNINFVQDYTSLQHNHINSRTLPKPDRASVIIDNLAKAVVLPQRGKFLQTVLQAGPLLQTLLVAGPLPRWRNPPQFQPFQSTPFLIKGCQPKYLNPKPVSTCGSAQAHSASMFSFGASLSSGSLISPLMNVNDYAPLAKRQRFS